MDEIVEDPSIPTPPLKRQFNHDSEPGTNGDSVEDVEASPKRAKLSDDSQVTNHKTLPAELVFDSAGLNGAIAEPSPDDSAVDTPSQVPAVPPPHRTATNGGGETAVDSGAMQADKPASTVKTTDKTTDIDSSGAVVGSDNVNTARTLCEGVENSSGNKEEPSSEQKTNADSNVQDSVDKDTKVVLSESGKDAVSMGMDTGKGTGEGNSVANGLVKQSTLTSTRPGEESSGAKVEQAEDLSSSGKKESISVRPEAKQPTFSRRKDSRPLNIREWTESSLSRAEDGDEDGESMDEDDMEVDPNKQRVTRSRTRKEKGIEDPPPKVYAELSEDSDIDDSPPISPWIDPLSKLTPEQREQRERSQQLLQEALRIEESKLLFLKKVKQNQAQPAIVPPPTNHPPTNLSQNKLEPHKSATPTSAQLQQQVNRARNALSKQGFPLGNHPGQHPHQRGAMPLLIRGSVPQGGRPGQGGPPPLMLVPGKQNSHAQVTQNRVQTHQMHGRQQQASKQPHVLQQRQGMHMTNQQVAHQRTNAAAAAAAAAAQETQSAASRQAAAKLALRKQLEKTLLQIPPPKPPPPELHFLPSAANSEFIILVGLEEVVNTILKLEEKKDSDKENPKFLNPYKCGQCKTDFTTIWKQDPKKGIMCEACIVSNQKRALKAEHTNRLKTAFVKALQQEQEIEQRMQQTHQTKPAQAHVVHQPTRSMYTMSSQQSVPSVRRVLNPPPVVNQQRVPTSYQYIQHLHHGGHASGQIPMLTKQQINSVYRMPTTDRQREYLLDMIPSKGLGQQPIVWK